MKKRVIGLLLALVLLMSLLPAGTMASGGEGESGLTELWVNGVNMCSVRQTASPWSWTKR